MKRVACVTLRVPFWRAIYSLPLGVLTVEKRDLLGILAHAHKIETEIGFVTLLLEIKRRQRPADQMREDRSDNGVNERRPKQIAGDHPGGAENMQRGRSG